MQQVSRRAVARLQLAPKDKLVATITSHVRLVVYWIGQKLATPAETE